MSTFGERLRKARDDAGLQQSEVAERVGVTRVTVSNWERDVTVPGEENFEALARLFGMAQSELRYGAAWIEAEGRAEPVPGQEPSAIAVEEFVSDATRLVRALRTLPTGVPGRPFKIAMLNIAEQLAIELGASLPREYFELRRRVILGEL